MTTCNPIQPRFGGKLLLQKMVLTRINWYSPSVQKLPGMEYSYHTRPCDKTRITTTADSSDENLVNVQGLQACFRLCERGQHAGASGTSGVTCSCRQGTPAGFERRRWRLGREVGGSDSGAKDGLHSSYPGRRRQPRRRRAVPATPNPHGVLAALNAAVVK